MKPLEMSALEPSWDHAFQSFHSTRGEVDIQESKGCVSGHIANSLKFHCRLWDPNPGVLYSEGAVGFSQPLTMLLEPPEPACLDLNPDLPVISCANIGKLLSLSLPPSPRL